MRPGLLAMLTLSAAAAAALLLPAGALADFQTLYNDYRADGVINGCSYSSSELSAGLSEIPADIREYDPGFEDAINAALDQIAAGCGVSPRAVAAKNSVTASDGSPGPALPHALALQTVAAGRGMPAILVALIAVLGAALGTTAVLAAGHYYGWDLRGRLAPVSGAARRAERHLADGLHSLRDRLGF